MAKLSGTASKWGAFLDSSLDRLGDGAVFGGLLLYFAYERQEPVWAALTPGRAGLRPADVLRPRSGRESRLPGDGGLAARADRLLIILAGALLAGLRGPVRAGARRVVPGGRRSGHRGPAQPRGLPAGQGTATPRPRELAGPGRPRRLPGRLGRWAAAAGAAAALVRSPRRGLAARTRRYATWPTCGTTWRLAAGRPGRRSAGRGRPAPPTCERWSRCSALPHWRPDEIVGRVRGAGEAPRLRRRQAESGAIVVLPHSGNWDLAGAWACLSGFPVTTVVEVLGGRRTPTSSPSGRGLGMEPIGHTEPDVMRRLAAAAAARPDGLPDRRPGPEPAPAWRCAGLDIPSGCRPGRRCWPGAPAPP